MFARIFTVAVLLLALASPMAAKELKVLMIGNSFSICVGNNLPQIVANDPDNKLVLTSAYIGGCTFERHYNNLVKSESNPSLRPYRITVWDSAAENKQISDGKGNVNELLKNNQYDIITIQQGSQKSFDFAAYEPFAGEIIKYIRKYQKNAEIVVHQTWSYRCDSKRFSKLIENQDIMYDKLKAAYGKLAEKYQFRVIPMGDAVQAYRAATPVKFAVSTAEFVYPNLPSDAGDVVGKFAWRVDKKTKQRSVGTDSHHLNKRGEYMQAVLWYMFLFNAPVEKVKFVPDYIPAAEAALLQSSAAKALKDCKQVK